MSEYGNSYFTLSCSQGTIYGVLSEMPSFGMSTEWEEGPQAALNNFIAETVNNEKVEFLAMAAAGGASSYKRFLANGENNARTYKTCSRLEFNLKFRVYSGQNIGTESQSGPGTVFKCLSGAFPPESMGSGNFDFKDLLKNGVAAAEGLEEIFKELTTEKTPESAGGEPAGGSTPTPTPTPASTPAQAQSGVPLENKKEFAKTKLNEMSDTTVDMTGQSNLIGACIYYLNIMNYFFKKPIPVVITGFSYTPSKEVHTSSKKSRSFYYDFEITCHTWEIMSADTWSGIIG